jgi:hypothetical protein
MLLFYHIHNSKITANHNENFIQTNEEIILIYIGSSECYYCNDKSLPAVLSSISDNLESIAHKSDMSFKSIASTIDYSLDSSFKHLEKIGSFDEITIGGGSNNVLSMYLYEKGSAVIAVPQISILYRKYNPSIVNNESVKKIEKDSILFQTAGLNNIHGLDAKLKTHSFRFINF